MKKAIFPVSVPYSFDPAHKGAPYTFDGVRYVNAGEWKEVEFKGALGYAPVKDANGSYDMTDDVPEIGASVKSGKATLVNKVLGESFTEIKARYMATVHSTLWVWVSIIDDELTAYYMSKEEFGSFLDVWAGYAADRKVIRFKAESGKMLRWLDERCEG